MPADRKRHFLKDYFLWIINVCCEIPYEIIDKSISVLLGVAGEGGVFSVALSKLSLSPNSAQLSTPRALARAGWTRGCWARGCWP